jgi:hypothetical protein
MDFTLLAQALIILILIASLDAIAYLIALKFDAYYRHKIPMVLALHKEISKGVKKITDKGSAVMSALKPQEKPVEKLLAFMELPAKPENKAPENKESCRGQRHEHRFNVNQRVELFGSNGEKTGKIISFNHSNSRDEYRYLVNWGKDGIWWVSEDQIEFAEHKGIEVNA